MYLGIPDSTGERQIRQERRLEGVNVVGGKEDEAGGPGRCRCRGNVVDAGHGTRTDSVYSHPKKEA